MDSIELHTNIEEVTESIRKKLEKLDDKEYLLLPVCQNVIELMHKRIHTDGLASDGTAIGTYSSSYLKTRQDKYNRTADTKIIVSLTRKMEGSWITIPTEAGYGIGFVDGLGTYENPGSIFKARYVEEMKNKHIFSMSESELEYARTKFQKLIDAALNS